MTNSAKKTIDAIFWGGLLLLPLVAYVVILIKGEPLSFSEFYATYASFRIAPIETALTAVVQVFDPTPTQEMLSVAAYLSYLVFIEVVHIAVDFLLLLPRMCQNIQDKIGGKHK